MKQILATILLIYMAVMFPVPVQADSLDTVSGVISEDGQLIGTNGVIYEIAENELGLELMEMTDNQVKVRGKVIVTDDTATIIVAAYEKVRK